MLAEARAFAFGRLLAVETLPAALPATRPGCLPLTAGRSLPSRYHSALPPSLALLPCSYNVIIADVLVGSPPAYSGVLPSLLGRHDGAWWLSRPAVLAALLLGVVVPTLVPRSLRVVARFSSFSVCMLFVLASSISSLALLAVARGAVAPGVHVLPTMEELGGTPLAAASSVLTVVSGECCSCAAVAGV